MSPLRVLGVHGNILSNTLTLFVLLKICYNYNNQNRHFGISAELLFTFPASILKNTLYKKKNPIKFYRDNYLSSKAYLVQVSYASISEIGIITLTTR